VEKQDEGFAIMPRDTSKVSSPQPHERAQFYFNIQHSAFFDIAISVRDAKDSRARENSFHSGAVSFQ
jgi:hypothetical protein